MAIAGIGALTAAVLASTSSASAATTGHKHHHKPIVITSSGLKPGAIKHVWLIILENKSYDSTFTGLNQNTYLWKSLPAQGVLLKNYYGTGHYSMDNYISMVSGQGPIPDTQSDCDVAGTNIGTNADILTSGPNAGQVLSKAGPNGADGTNGCVYPQAVPTLFNQLDAAGKTWKGYAQDLHNQPGREDGVCGYPGTSASNPNTDPTYLSATTDHPFPTGVTSFTGAQANDQYVAKHFPFPWFHSLTGDNNGKGLTAPAQGGNDCDAHHIANLDDPASGLFHDLQHESTTPAFSWITPNNCSDAHDAICKGNNLSGAFNADGTPNYDSPTPNDPQSTTPKNYTGGLYASDLFLKYYIPMIEKSPAFKDGGLIDVTFDEANPPYSYGGSFNDANQYGPTLGIQANAAGNLRSDYAGENINGKNVATEPTGPNTPLKTDANGNQLYPGPGYNAFINRPPACTSTAPNVPADCVPGIVRSGSGSTPGARTDTAIEAGPNSSFVIDRSISAADTGRIVTDTVDTTGPGGTSPIPADTFVGSVSVTGPVFPSSSAGPVTSNSFQLVDANGNPVTPTGAVTSLSLSAEGDPMALAPGQTPDPLFDAKDATRGGGDTGSILISPYIKPGSSTSVFYNHYSWLRTMEDLFRVDGGHGHKPGRLPVGTISGGIDGEGHLGFAAQKGLRAFGRDVFTNPSGH